MRVRKVEIPTTYKEQDFTIIHLTDPHHDAPSFDMNLFKAARKRVLKTPRCYMVLTGDWTDDDRPSGRARRRMMGDGRPEVTAKDDQREMNFLSRNIIPLYKELAEAGKILGVLDGDHYRVLGAQTTAQYICQQLKIPDAYIGERVGYVSLRFLLPATRGSLQYDILVRHGMGGTASNGASVTAQEKQSQGWDFDLTCGGHNHRNHAHVMQWCRGPNVPGNDVRWSFRAFLRGSSLVRGYEIGKTHYPEKAEYTPLTCGWGECRVTIGKTFRAGLLEVKMVQASVVAG